MWQPACPPPLGFVRRLTPEGSWSPDAAVWIRRRWPRRLHAFLPIWPPLPRLVPQHGSARQREGRWLESPCSVLVARSLAGRCISVAQAQWPAPYPAAWPPCLPPLPCLRVVPDPVEDYSSPGQDGGGSSDQLHRRHVPRPRWLLAVSADGGGFARLARRLWCPSPPESLHRGSLPDCRLLGNLGPWPIAGSHGLRRPVSSPIGRCRPPILYLVPPRHGYGSDSHLCRHLSRLAAYTGRLWKVGTVSLAAYVCRGRIFGSRHLHSRLPGRRKRVRDQRHLHDRGGFSTAAHGWQGLLSCLPADLHSRQIRA